MQLVGSRGRKKNILIILVHTSEFSKFGVKNESVSSHFKLSFLSVIVVLSVLDFQDSLELHLASRWPFSALKKDLYFLL